MLINLLYETLIQHFYLLLSLFFLLIVFLMYRNTEKIYRLTVLHPQVIGKVDMGTNDKYKKTDSKCYRVLYDVYNMIGTAINIENSEMFDEKYLLKLNEAKKIFYGVKRNKNLVKSNYLLSKILKKISTFEINKNEIDDTIIYLIVLILNKKN